MASFTCNFNMGQSVRDLCPGKEKKTDNFIAVAADAAVCEMF